MLLRSFEDVENIHLRILRPFEAMMLLRSFEDVKIV